jgi:hypothetical protein
VAYEAHQPDDDGYESEGLDASSSEDVQLRRVEPFSIAKQTAVRSLAKALVDQYGHAEATADAIAQAVEDPSAVRRQLQAPDRTKVFGGSLLMVSARISAFAVVPHVVNGRIIGSTPYPASDADGTGTHTEKFWPERDFGSLTKSQGGLLLRGGTRERVVDALETADVEVRAQNPLEESIRSGGVFVPITVAPMRIVTKDDDHNAVTVLTAPDGSSRLAWCHRILGIAPSDIVYGSLAAPRVARAQLQSAMSVLQRPHEDVSDAELERARAATLPARIIIGFDPDPDSAADLVTAIDQYVALLHLEPPTLWTAPARENKIADSVVDALLDAEEISIEQALWFAGMLSPEEATEAGFSEWADERAAEIFHVISADSATSRGKAVSHGIRKLSLKKRARRPPRAAAAASLALRSFSTAHLNRRKVATTALQRTLDLDEIWQHPWRVTHRDPDELRDAALDELDEKKKPTKSARELAALAAYHLIVHGVLGTEESGEVRGPGGETRPADKRPPARVLQAMMESPQGIHAMHRVILDGRTGTVPLQIDADGQVAQNVNGDPLGPMTNFWLRSTFRAKPVQTTSSGNATPQTPLQELNAALDEFLRLAEEVPDLIAKVESIAAEDDTRLIDREGMDPARASEIRAKLDLGLDRASAYAQTWRQRHPRPSAAEPTDVDDDEAP